MNDQLSIVDLQQVADYAWVAGIVDGEGCIHRRKRSKIASLEFQLHIEQTDINGLPEMLVRLKNIFNTGNIVGPYHYRGYKNIKPVYRWSVSGDRAREILRLIWPYLGIVKRKQAYKAGFRLTTWELGLEHLVKHEERDK